MKTGASYDTYRHGRTLIDINVREKEREEGDEGTLEALTYWYSIAGIVLYGVVGLLD